tara:strand:- start:375 stop:1949 length:1575 start_codon:yes stop_codon:yes gene_type:complete
MADFNKGNATDLKNNTAQYAEGSYVSADRILVVGQSPGAFGSKNDKKVTIRTVTAWTKKDSKVQSSTTVIYALDNKNDKWQPVGITDDGGTTIKLSGDDRYPLVGDNDDLKNNFTYYEELTEGLQDTQDRSGLGIKNNMYNSMDESTLNGSSEGGTLVDNVLVNMSDSESSKIRAGFRGRGKRESDPAKQDGSRPVPNPNKPSGLTNQTFDSPIFSSQGLSYPIDLDLNTQDALKITIHQRKPREFSGAQRNESSFDRGVNNADGSERALATIYLPVSGNISDSNNVDYNSNSLNFLQGFAIQQISKGIKGGLGQDEGIAANLNKAFGQIGEQNIPVKNLIGDYTAATALKGLAGQSVNNIQSRFSGQILNPNMELLFNGPKLRNFQFQYRLTPRERDESVRIQQIITAIKRHMAPKRGKNGGFFLGAPDFFRLQYLYRNNQHRFLNKFKDCALIGFDINYAPEGTYATYPDGGMHSYLMTMRFAELDPIYFEDYQDNDIANTEIPAGRTLGEVVVPGAGGIGF